jgi:excisionase family DNA binding protein
MKNLVLSTRNIDDFILELADEVVKKIYLNNVKEHQPEADNPLNIDEIAKLTGYTKPTIYAYCQNNAIPYHKKNGRLFFFKSEIIDWIKTGKQKTLKELEADADVYLSNKNNGRK